MRWISNSTTSLTSPILVHTFTFGSIVVQGYCWKWPRMSRFFFRVYLYPFSVIKLIFLFIRFFTANLGLLVALCLRPFLGILKPRPSVHRGNFVKIRKCYEIL